MIKTSVYLPEAEAAVKDYILNLTDPIDIINILSQSFGLDISYDHDNLCIELDGEIIEEDDLYDLSDETVEGATSDQIAKAYGEFNNARASITKLFNGIIVIELFED